MKLSTISNAVLLSISLSLVGCGGGGDDAVGSAADDFTVSNPIADMTGAVGTAFDFTIPENTCSDGIFGIDYTITTVNPGLGLSLINDNQLQGTPNTPGVIDVTFTCASSFNSATDSFSITIEDVNLDPTLTVEAPTSAMFDTKVSLVATAEDANTTDSIVSYSWTQTAGEVVTLADSDKATATFTAPDTTEQTQLSFTITVTDNDGSTATESVDIDLISSLAPTPSLSFPLAFGAYSSETIDMFGRVDVNTGSDVETVVLTIGTADYTAQITGNQWRVEDVSYTEDVTAVITATSSTGLKNTVEKFLDINTVYKSDIDNDIVDIAIDETNDMAYVQVVGKFVDEIQLIQFDLAGTANSEIRVVPEVDFPYIGYVPTSIAYHAGLKSIIRTYSDGVTAVNLATNTETVLSNDSNGTGTNFTRVGDVVTNDQSGDIYIADNGNDTIVKVDSTSGERTDVATLGAAVSVISNNANDALFAVGYSDIGDSAYINKVDVLPTAVVTELTANELNGPITDFALNETDNEIYFIDSSNNLSKINLTTNDRSIVVENLFSVENLDTVIDAKIGLHYHAKNNLLYAVGRDADSNDSNSLFVIDVTTGNYGTIAKDAESK